MNGGQGRAEISPGLKRLNFMNQLPIPTRVRESETVYGFADRPKVTSSREAAAILRQYFEDIDEMESFHVLVMSMGNTVISHKLISIGGVSGCVADPKIIFRYALGVKGCAGVIVSHNHPSGNLKASQSDIELTKKLRDGGKLLDVQLLDHVILSPEGSKYLSMVKRGRYTPLWP